MRCLLRDFLGASLALAAASPALAQDAAFPLRIGPTGRHLVDQRGVPFLIHGDSPWSLTHNLTFEEAVRYMTARKAQGFNTLLVSVPDAYDPDGNKSYSPGPLRSPALRRRRHHAADRGRTGRTSTASSRRRRGSGSCCW